MGKALAPALIIAYLLAFVSANLLVNHFGAYGLWFSSLFLIPFDFIIRCWFQERIKSKSTLLLMLFGLTIAVALITISFNAVQIAYASTVGFTAAQLGAGIWYRMLKNKSLFIRVNMTDLIAIVCDSIAFQILAFGTLNPLVTIGQVVVKFAGGLLWYYILFKRLKIQKWLIK